MKAELETERKNTAATIEKMNADFAKRTEDIQASLSERQNEIALLQKELRNVKEFRRNKVILGFLAKFTLIIGANN